MPRPVDFNQAIADHIIRRMIEGETLPEICDEQSMPSTGTVQYWRHKYPSFAIAYDAARVALAESIFDELLFIADDSRRDWTTRRSRSGETIDVPNHEVIHRSKLRIDTRLKVLTRLSPVKHAEKIDLTSSDGSMSPAAMSEEAKAAQLTALHRAAMARLAAKAPPPATTLAEDAYDASDLI